MKGGACTVGEDILLSVRDGRRGSRGSERAPYKY
jgi:hypothetical protein